MRTVNGYSLTARADLPTSTDSQRSGIWKAQASYYGKKSSSLKLDVSFYSIGGSVSANGVGISGSGSNTGGSISVKSSVANASGRVYAHGLAVYVGMYSTASFSYGNSYYSETTKI